MNSPLVWLMSNLVNQECNRLAVEEPHLVEVMLG